MSLFSCAGDKKNNALHKDSAETLAEIPLDNDFAKLVILDSLGVTGSKKESPIIKIDALASKGKEITP